MYYNEEKNKNHFNSFGNYNCIGCKFCYMAKKQHKGSYIFFEILI